MYRLLSSESPRRSRLAIAVLFNVIGLLPGLPAAVADEHAQYALSATLEHRFKPTGQVLNRSRVVFNGNGFRIDALPLTQGQAMVSNLQSGKTWFIDTTRAYLHEVPFSEVEGAPRLQEAFIGLPGFIDSIPCSMQSSTLLGDVSFKGQSLERWQCALSDSDNTDNNDLPIEQYYSREYGMVVYSRSGSNVVSELLNIRKRPVHPDTFAAPEGLHRVSIQQFMGQVQPLTHYRQSSVRSTD